MPREKKATSRSRMSATSAGSRADRMTESGQRWARVAVARAWAAASPTRSILLKAISRGTKPAPISASTSVVTSSWRSKLGSDASTTCTSKLASSYGAAGALIVVFVWVFYSTQIFLLGAEFTKVYAARHGSKQNRGPVGRDQSET